MQEPSQWEIDTGVARAEREAWALAIAAGLSAIPVAAQNRGALRHLRIDGQPGLELVIELTRDSLAPLAARRRAAQALRRLDDPDLLWLWVELIAAEDRGLAERGLAELVDLAPRATTRLAALISRLDACASGAGAACHPDLIAAARTFLLAAAVL